MNCTKIEEFIDGEQIYVHGVVVSDLIKFLDLSVPWIWILDHCPDQSLQWWKASIPLNEKGSIFTGLVRRLVFDLQLPTCDFISRASEFDSHGLLLVQSHSQMPNTLCLERIPEAQRNAVLIQNGATLKIFLPHALETLQIQSFIKGYLSTVVDI
jgi:hypothetical protein